MTSLNETTLSESTLDETSRPSRSLTAFLVAMLGVAIVAAGCGGPADDGVGADGTVRVFAAASLTDAFSELATGFETENPEVRVELNLAGSSALRAQILAGAPADVFASANRAVMDDVIEAEAAGDPQDFATNRLTIIVPDGNPGRLAGIEDFTRTELFLGLCASQVPCGVLADTALAAAGVTPSVDTREPDVRALATKVALGELDGGLAYETDARALADEVEQIEIPSDGTEPARYPIAVLTEAEQPDLGRRFVEFVLSPAGRTTLADHGFGQP